MNNEIEKAVELALRYGMIDGDHHKQWVIDQMLRIILSERYEEVIKEYNSNTKYECWDEGCGP